MGFKILRRIDSLLGMACYVLATVLDFIIKRHEPQGLRKFKNIVFIKLWGLGNLAIIWPLIEKVRHKYPHAKITFITFSQNKGFLEKHDAINRMIYFPISGNIFSIVCRAASILSEIRKEGADAVINFETFNNASALFAYLTGAGVRAGINNRYEGVFYNFSVAQGPDRHISETFNQLLLSVGISSAYSYHFLGGRAEDEVKARHVLEHIGCDDLICIHPGTSSNYIGKRWKDAYFSRLADLLHKESSAHIVFTGTKEEGRLVRGIIGKMQDSGRVSDLCGKLTIWEFVELLRRAHLFISSDTGPVHIAASLGINTAVLYGPTTPKRYGPLNNNSLVFWKGLPCGPCVGIKSVTHDCSKGYVCLDFSPEEVFQKIKERFFNEKKIQLYQECLQG